MQSLVHSSPEQVFVAVYKTTPQQSHAWSTRPASIILQLSVTAHHSRAEASWYTTCFQSRQKNLANGMVCTSWHMDAYTQHRCTERKRSLKRTTERR